MWDFIAKILKLDIEKVQNLRYLNKCFVLLGSFLVFAFVIVYGTITKEINPVALTAASTTFATAIGLSNKSTIFKKEVQ